uniref:Nudix hydrolase domain-containing protein n=1 Tax=Leptocylindrus danicus TaxID=163516 RepID=A0A6U2S3A3_9STRA|mmetsp:Transcript_5493/g.8078  ORF Transcript_5493/g.8078 Transcript_5493/m.8078 type:complete len:227 (+) Transcript_5493:32-712(+)
MNILVFQGLLLLLSCFGQPSMATQHPSQIEVPQPQQQQHRIISDEVVYSRWRKIIRRVVQFPAGNTVDFDIVDQKGTGAVTIFAWCSKTKTATLVREYNPGCHKSLHGVAAGLIEEDKHQCDPEIAARHELEEECHLQGGRWYRLTADGATVPMDKYVVTEIAAYLVIDPETVSNPRPLDAEEDIEIISGVSVPEIFDMIRSGGMNLVGGWACMLAIEKLRELGEI